jgi:hypothetical protein
MIRLPSVVHVIRSARETAQRFPWVLLSATIGACLSWVLVVDNISSSPSLEELLSRCLLVAMLGISGFFALAIGLEQSPFAPRRNWIGLAGGALVLIPFFLSYNHETSRIYVYRFFQLALASHLLVAVAPYYRRGEIAAFWQFNRLSFQRILQSVLFSGMLFIGLSIALWAVQSLLGLKVEWKVYYFLFLAIGYLFNTWFFLAGIPSDWRNLETDSDYPAGLRLFVQFILLPLITLYVLILYAYLIKILAIREWPRGTIGWLVSIVSVFGMLALLLVHPLRNQPGYRWIRLYSRSFYAGLFPLIILLLMAIWRRVSEYGLTEDRYFLTVLSLWMIGIAGYFTLRRQPSTKVIPISLALVAVVTTGGSWGPYSVCQQNQLGRLRTILDRVGVLKNKHIQKAAAPPEFKDRKEISAIVTYLLEMHGTASLQPWFLQDLKALGTDGGHRTAGKVFSWWSEGNLAAKVTELMGVTYVNTWEARTNPRVFSVTSKRQWQEAQSVAGYDYLLTFNLFRSGMSSYSQTAIIGSRHFEVYWRGDGQTIEFREGNTNLVSLDLKPFFDRIQQQPLEGSNTLLPEDLMTLEGESDAVKIKLVFAGFTATREPSGIQLTNAHGQLLLKFKDPSN